MNLFVMIDPNYRNTYWCRQTLHGILEETSRKKYSYTLLHEEKPETVDWDALFQEDRRLLIVIGTSVSWMPNLLKQLKKNKIQVILVSMQPPTGFAGVSAILMDHEGATRALIHYLLGLGRKRIALYGMNPNSSADKLKIDCYQSMMQDITNEQAPNTIFYNYASLSDCYNDFSEQFHPHSSFDAVICANDVVAISLIRHLEQAEIHVPDDLYLVSFGDTLMSRLFSTPLTTVSLKHNELGHQAVSAFAYLVKNPTVTSITVKVECKLVIRASTGQEHASDFSSDIATMNYVPQIDFYDDPEVQETLAIENFINQCDELDLQILEGLFASTTYSDLAERLYLAENALKYRIRRMISWLSVDNRTELSRLLSAYLSDASLHEARRIKEEIQA
jgi:DNA-binding LacI/PurR family transcriptional regulator